MGFFSITALDIAKATPNSIRRQAYNKAKSENDEVRTKMHRRMFLQGRQLIGSSMALRYQRTEATVFISKNTVDRAIFVIDSDRTNCRELRELLSEFFVPVHGQLEDIFLIARYEIGRHGQITHGSGNRVKFLGSYQAIANHINEFPVKQSVQRHEGAMSLGALLRAKLGYE